MKSALQPKTGGLGKGEPQPNRAVDVGDHVYVTHRGGPCTALVMAHGKHGMTCRIDSQVHKLTWDSYLGHKKRPLQSYSIVDQGEDGMIVEDANKRRRYIGTPNESQEDPMVVKSQRPVLLFMKAEPSPAPTKRKPSDEDWTRVSKGMPPAQHGQHIGYENGEYKGHGKVSAVGQHGVTVKDSKGGEHRVRHEQITHHWGGAGQPDQSPHVRYVEHEGVLYRIRRADNGFPDEVWDPRKGDFIEYTGAVPKPPGWGTEVDEARAHELMQPPEVKEDVAAEPELKKEPVA